MSFLNEFGGLKKIQAYDRQSMSTKDMLLEGIKDQRNKLAEGYKDLKPKNRTMWFKPDGRFIPLVGMYRLFGDHYVSYEEGKELYVLDKLLEAIYNEDGDIKIYLDEIDEKRKKPRKARSDKGKIKGPRKKHDIDNY